MSLNYRFIISSCLLFSACAQAHEFFLDPLYWQATESVDWVYVNSLTTPNQQINYKTITFDAAPGIRFGGLFDLTESWNTQFYYTKYYTSGNDTAAGNLTSAFLGAKIAEPSSGYFYESGQVHATINYNILDLNFGKRFIVNQALMLRPFLGLEGGWINQNFNTNFQGTTSVTEKIKNDFSGIGPKIGIEGKLALLQSNHLEANLIATFATAYLLGNWTITDTLNATPPKSININVANRKFGAITLQALLGLGFEYKNLAIKAGYEINDWFNQCQIFDDDTGGHNNDLILQGLTLSFTYRTTV